MELDSKALALFTEGYEKIIEGLARLGMETEGRSDGEQGRDAEGQPHDGGGPNPAQHSLF